MSGSAHRANRFFQPEPQPLAARVAFFAAVPQWSGVYFYVRMTSSNVYQTGLYVLEEVPTLLLVTLHSQQLLAWADSYSTAMGTPAAYGGVLRRVYAGNGLLYVAQIVIWVAYDRTQAVLDTDYWSLIAAVLHLLAVLVVAAGLIRYGRLVRSAVQVVPTSLQLRMRQVRNVDIMVTVCSVAFTVRCVALVGASWATFTDATGFADSETGADVAMTALFFVTTELGPLCLILWYHSARPGRRTRRAKAGQYRTASAGRKRLSLSAAIRSMRFSFSPMSAPRDKGPTLTRSASAGRRLFFGIGSAGKSEEATERTPLFAGSAAARKPSPSPPEAVPLLPEHDEEDEPQPRREEEEGEPGLPGFTSVAITPSVSRRDGEPPVGPSP